MTESTSRDRTSKSLTHFHTYVRKICVILFSAKTFHTPDGADKFWLLIHACARNFQNTSNLKQKIESKEILITMRLSFSRFSPLMQLVLIGWCNRVQRQAKNTRRSWNNSTVMSFAMHYLFSEGVKCTALRIWRKWPFHFPSRAPQEIERCNKFFANFSSSLVNWFRRPRIRSY